MKPKWQEKSRQMLRLLAGARMSKVLFAEKCGCENHRAPSFLIIGDGMGRDLRHWENATDLHRSKRQNQCHQLSATGPPRRIEAVLLPPTLS